MRCDRYSAGAGGFAVGVGYINTLWTLRSLQLYTGDRGYPNLEGPTVSLTRCQGCGIQLQAMVATDPVASHWLHYGIAPYRGSTFEWLSSPSADLLLGSHTWFWYCNTSLDGVDEDAAAAATGGL